MKVVEWVRALVMRAAASTWTVIVVKSVGAGLLLAILAVIGHVAAARAAPNAATSMPRASITHALDRDGGADPVALSSLSSAEAGVPPAALPVPPVPSASSSVPSPGPARPGARATPEAPVFLNHASVDELRRLPGVGPKRAEAILQLRQRLGRFHRLEDLMRVKGIGRNAVKKWRPLVRLDAPASANEADGGA